MESNSTLYPAKPQHGGSGYGVAWNTPESTDRRMHVTLDVYASEDLHQIREMLELRGIIRSLRVDHLEQEDK